MPSPAPDDALKVLVPAGVEPRARAGCADRRQQRTCMNAEIAVWRNASILGKLGPYAVVDRQVVIAGPKRPRRFSASRRRRLTRGSSCLEWLGMKGDALKGHLELLLLATLRSGPAHGYAIIEDLKQRSGGAFDLPEGTIYPALHRLERSGAIESAWFV